MSLLAAGGLILLGILVGAYGTLIGAGGGFVLVPILLLLYPKESPTTITSISLAVVFFNALSGSIAYARMRRIDLTSGWRFALATVPGSILGAFAINFFSRGAFNILFAVLLMLLAVYIFIKSAPVHETLGPSVTPKPGYVVRRFTDAEGETYDYTYHQPLGLLLSAFVGFLSSLLGIGGGIVHVPILVTVLSFPAHVATATSHFVLAVATAVGTGVHVVNGDLTGGWGRVLFLGVGVTVGAQAGARLSRRIHGPLILRLLAVALFLVSIRLLWLALQR